MIEGEYFDQIFRLAGSTRERDAGFGLAGKSVRVEFGGPGLVEHISRAMAHLPPAPSRNADLEVRCFDSSSNGIAMPAPPWTSTDYLPRGAIRGWENGRYRAQYVMDHHHLYLMDCQTARAVYWAQRPEFVPWWEQTFPLRQILHWWSHNQRLQPIHAGAVGFAEGGVLIAGKSGMGKSTSCLSCLNSPLLYAGDDYVLLDLEQETPHAWSLYGTAKVVPDNLSRLHWLDQWIVNRAELETQKALIYVNEQAPEKVSAGFPIRAILLPRVSGKTDTQLRPASAFDAMQAIAPTCVFHLIGDAPAAMSKIADLSRAVPVYWLEAGTDLNQIPATIVDLLRETK